jgi:hypothetical protein
MSVQRLTLSDIIRKIRLALGETDPARSKMTDADLILSINAYGNVLPSRVGQVSREHGMSFREGIPHHFMWHTKGTISGSAGSADVSLPADFSTPIEFWESNIEKPLHIVDKPSLWHYRRLRKGRPSLPEEIVLEGYDVSTNQRTATLFPTPPAGFTPSIDVRYYRIPAEMPGNDEASEEPDADPKYHLLWVYGPLIEILAPDSPVWQNYVQLEHTLIRDLVQEAGSQR